MTLTLTPALSLALTLNTHPVPEPGPEPELASDQSAAAVEGDGYASMILARAGPVRGKKARSPLYLP